MSIGPLANIAAGFLQSIISPALKSAGAASTTTTNSSSGAGASQADTSQLSPFAQILNTLQQVQQSNPAQYAQVTQQISANLQSASQTAQANGNTSAATELSTLATDFSNASKSGQLPSVQDLAKGAGGGHHHHHHAPAADANASSSASASTSTSAAQTLSQLFASYQSGAASSASTDPMSIISSTLSSSGVATS